MMLGSLPMESCLLLAMSVLSQFAGLAMNMSGGKATRSAPSAKPGSNAIRAGCARVAGDNEEDGIDDLENEFNFVGRGKQDSQHFAEAMLHGHMTHGYDMDMPHSVRTLPQVPLLTDDQMVDDIPPEQHTLVPAFMGGGGKKIHPLPFADPGLPEWMKQDSHCPGKCRFHLAKSTPTE